MNTDEIQLSASLGSSVFIRVHPWFHSREIFPIFPLSVRRRALDFDAKRFKSAEHLAVPISFPHGRCEELRRGAGSEGFADNAALRVGFASGRSIRSTR